MMSSEAAPFGPLQSQELLPTPDYSQEPYLYDPEKTVKQNIRAVQAFWRESAFDSANISDFQSLKSKFLEKKISIQKNPFFSCSLYSEFSKAVDEQLTSIIYRKRLITHELDSKEGRSDELEALIGRHFTTLIAFSINTNKFLDMCDISFSLRRKIHILDWTARIYATYKKVVHVESGALDTLHTDTLKRLEEHCFCDYWNLYARSQECLLHINQLLANETPLFETSNWIEKRPLSQCNGVRENGKNCPWDLGHSFVFLNVVKKRVWEDKQAFFLFLLKHKDSSLNIVNGLILKGMIPGGALYEEMDILRSNKCFPAISYALGNRGFTLPIQRTGSKDISIPQGEGLLLSYIPQEYFIASWYDLPRKAEAPCPVRRQQAPFDTKVYIKVGQTIVDGILQHILCTSLEQKFYILMAMESDRLAMAQEAEAKREYDGLKEFIKHFWEEIKTFFDELHALCSAGYTFGLSIGPSDGAIYNVYENTQVEIERALGEDRLDNAMTEIGQLISRLKKALRSHDSQPKCAGVYTWLIRKVEQYSIQEGEGASLTEFPEDNFRKILITPPGCSLAFQILMISVEAYMKKIEQGIANSKLDSPSNFDFYVPYSVLYKEIINVMRDFKCFLEDKKSKFSSQQLEILENITNAIDILSKLTQIEDEEENGGSSMVDDEIESTPPESEAPSSIGVKVSRQIERRRGRTRGQRKRELPSAPIAMMGEVGPGSAYGGVPSTLREITVSVLDEADDNTPPAAPDETDEVYLYSPDALEEDDTPVAEASVPGEPPTAAASPEWQKLEEFLDFCFGRGRVPEVQAILNHKYVKNIPQSVEPAKGGHFKVTAKGHVSLPRGMVESPIKYKIFVTKLVRFLCDQIETFSQQEKERLFNHLHSRTRG